MGDRGNIRILQKSGGEAIYLYTHYYGSELPQILAHALERGRDRWNDEPYLTRIIFSEMIMGPETLVPGDEPEKIVRVLRTLTDSIGLGITTYETDNDASNPILTVNVATGTVNNYPFEEFIKANTPAYERS